MDMFFKRDTPKVFPVKPKDKNLEEDFLVVQSDEMVFAIDKNTKTAIIIDFINIGQNIFIPRSIYYESQEYIIIHIYESISYELNSIVFDPNSEIKTLEDHIITNTSVKYVIIHPGLKKISKYVFSNCFFLERIDFLPVSQLEIIDYRAFHKTSIKSISIPPSTIQIGENAFEFCVYLQKVEIPANSKLKRIGAEAFSESGIKILSMPSSISELDESWCKSIIELNDITIFQSEQQNIMYFDDKFILQKSDPKSDVFDILAFARRDIKNAVIPPFIKKIAPYAFEHCTSIERIEFSENSELQEIGCYAFHLSSIEHITFPPHLTTIGNNCFELCIQLKTVEFSENSELKSIGNYAFKETIIESISFPHHLTTIGDNAFYYCKKLKNVEMPKDCELQTIGESAFFFTSIEKISFSPHLTLIKECAFRMCKNLKEIVFAPILNHLTIEKDIFGSSTPIENISISFNNIEFKKGWLRGLEYSDFMYFNQEFRKFL